MSKNPKLNVSLLKRIIKHLRQEPKRYNQSQWGKDVHEESNAPACGTQGCIAGWAVFLNVPQALWPHMLAGGAFTSGNTFICGLSCAPATKVAQEILGLNSKEAYALFSADNQTYITGPEGVKDAVRKINLLISDRAEFVRKYR